MAPVQAPRPPQPVKTARPVMRVTEYEKVSSGVILITLALAGLLVALIGMWFNVRIAEPEPPVVAVDIIPREGGYEDGDIDGTGEFNLNPTDPNSALAPGMAEQTSGASEALSEITEAVAADVGESLSGEGSSDAIQAFETALAAPSSNKNVTGENFEIGGTGSGGRGGSPTGNGRKPLGTGGGLRGGISREDRWVVRFDESTLDEYATQLDFFKIELGALFPDGRLVMITNMAASKPTMRETKSGKGEQRLYFRWRGGGRQKVDNELFKKAGINSESATILHFYDPNTENLLATVEQAHRNRKTTEIRKTYFAVRKEANNYRFVVTSQSYLR